MTQELHPRAPLFPRASGPRPLLAGFSGLVLLFLAEAPARGEPTTEKLRYNRDIRPLFAEKCFACHGADSAARKADLRLDREADATAQRPDGAAIVKGDTAKSLVVGRIKSGDPGEVMPPPSSKKKLKPEEIARLERWIAEGAEYEPHWSFIAPRRPPLAEVKNEAWARNPIDRFILAELEKAGLEPAPEADRRTLRAGASLDLTGLPPAPEDVEAFVADPSPDAYEKLVDRCLASPQLGRASRPLLARRRPLRRHARHPLRQLPRDVDLPRLGDRRLQPATCPSTGSRSSSSPATCCPSRRSISTSPPASIAATSPPTRAAPSTRSTRSSTRATAPRPSPQVWLGLTTGCAVCHDHKFDPLTQREFYELAAFFNNTTQAAMDGNIKDTPPIVPVPRAEDRESWDRVQVELADARKRQDERRAGRRPEFDGWLVVRDPRGGAPAAGRRPRAPCGPRGRTGERRGLPRGGRGAHRDRDGRPPVGGRARRRAGAQDPLRVADRLRGRRRLREGPGLLLRGLGEAPQGNLSGTLLARMDDREGKGFRGWDLTLENGRPGIHLIHRGRTMR